MKEILADTDTNVTFRSRGTLETFPIKIIIFGFQALAAQSLARLAQSTNGDKIVFTQLDEIFCKKQFCELNLRYQE